MIKQIDHPNNKLNKIWTCKLVEVAIFLLVCLVVDALINWHPLVAAPEPWKVILGRPPQALHIGVIFTLYVFSVITLTGAAFSAGQKPQLTWKQLGYRCGFIVFGACAGECSVLFTLLTGVCLSLYLFELGYIGIHLYQDSQHRIGNPT